MLVLPVFNKISGTQLSLPWNQWWLLPLIITAAFITGLIAGLYPAFYLSYFKPINTLKGNLSLGSKNAGLRSTLVVLQFTISIVLLISTSVIYKQMQYILNSTIGFDKEITQHLTPWQKVQLSRHPDRPYTLEYILKVFTNFVELHGDRNVKDDKAFAQAGLTC